MPKAIINRKESRASGIGAWVYKWLKQSGKRIQDLAEEMGISQPGLSYKIKNNAFTYADLLTVFDYLQVPDEEILFVMRM